MKEFQVQSKSYRGLILRLVIIFLLIMVFVLVRAVWNVYQKNISSEGSLNHSKGELKDLELQKSDLEYQVAWLSLPRGKEEEIRKNFSVAKEGEKVFIVVDDKQSATTTISDNNDKGWWVAVKRGLNNLFPF